MEFVRQIVYSSTLTSILDLPPSFQDIQVEAIVLPVDKKSNLNAAYSVSGSDISINPVKHSAYGRLKAYANPSLFIG
jgi:hypothetical protein